MSTLLKCYAECRCVVSRYASAVMLNVVMLSVVVLYAVFLSVVMLNVVMLGVVVLVSGDSFSCTNKL